MKNYIIGYYHLPGAMDARIYVEDTKAGRKVVDENIPYENLNESIEKYKNMYENYTVVEFKY